MVRTTSILCMLFTFALVAHAANDGKSTSNTPTVAPSDSVRNQSPTRISGNWINRFDQQKGLTKLPLNPPKNTRQRGEPRIDTHLSPAVHVNSTGLENRYGSQDVSATLNRLRSVRDTPLLQGATSESSNRTSKDISPSPETAQVDPPARTPSTVPAADDVNSSRRARLDTVGQGEQRDDAGPAGLPAFEEATLPENLDAKTQLPSVMTRRGLAEPTLAERRVEQSLSNGPQFAEPRVAQAPPASSRRAAEPLSVGPTLADADFIAELAPSGSGADDASISTTPWGSSVDPATGEIAPLQTTPPVNTTQSVKEPARMANLPRAPGPQAASPSAGLPVSQTLPEDDGAFPARTRLPIPSQPRNELEIAGPSEQGNLAVGQDQPVAGDLDTVAGNDTPRTFEQPPAAATGPITEDDAEEAILSNRSPVLVVKTHGPTKIRVGRPATYYVTAANHGDLSAEDVVVNVNVPNWAELTRNQSTAGAVRIEPNLHGDNVLQWSIRDLKPGSNQRLRIDLVPRASRPLELGVTWNLKSVSAMTQIEVEEPKLALAVVGPGDVRFGDTKLYSITVSNPGTGDADNVMLQLLPMNGAGGIAGERDLGTLKAGTQRTVEVELTARQAGEMAIRAQALADGGLRAEGNQPVRVRRPQLAIQAVGPKKRYAGTQARYTLKIANHGDATARDVLASAGLPSGAQFVKSSKNGAFDKNRNLVQWSVGTLRPGAEQVVEVIAVLRDAGDSRLDARVSSKSDQLTANDSVVTAVEALADLRLTVVDPVGPVPLETEVAYEVVVENRGTKAAREINIVGYFSEGIEPVAVEGWQAKVSLGEVRLETIPQVSPGQRLVIKVLAEASRSGNHVFRAELASNDPTTKTKLAVEEWTVFHADSEPLENDTIQNAEKPDGITLEPIQR